MVGQLLQDLARCPDVARVVVTRNIPEAAIDCPESLRPRVTWVDNQRPLGFGANHNQAFRLC